MVSFKDDIETLDNPTHLTRVRLFSTVNSLMFHFFDWTLEDFATILTCKFVDFRTAIDWSLSNLIGVVFVVLLRLINFLLGVSSHVKFQMLMIWNRFVANFAGERAIRKIKTFDVTRTSIFVDFVVKQKALFGVKHCAALDAAIADLVGLIVAYYLLTELLLVDWWTLEWIDFITQFSVVRLEMIYESFHALIGFSALFTGQSFADRFVHDYCDTVDFFLVLVDGLKLLTFSDVVHVFLGFIVMIFQVLIDIGERHLAL